MGGRKRTSWKRNNDLNCEIHLLANFEYGSQEEQYHIQKFKLQMENIGVIIHSIPFKRGTFLGNLKEVLALKKLLLCEHFDMIHAQTETGGMALGFAINNKKDTRYVYTPHGMSFYRGSSIKSWLLYYPLERWKCSKMNCNIAINNEEYSLLTKWDEKSSAFVHGIGFKSKEIKAYSKKIDIRNKIPQNAIVILSVGEINKNKNHKVVIEALSLINNSNVYYIICGDGPMRPELENRAEQIGLKDRVLFVGYRRDVDRFYKMANIFVFPSFHEGLPVSVMEAMSFSLPIICSDIRGNIELIDNGKGGLLFKPSDVKGLSKILERIILDTDSRIRMGVYNEKKVSDYSEDIVYSELKSIYSKYLNEGN